MAAGGLIVIGQSRAGKTTAINIVEDDLSKHGFRVKKFDDKDYLMNEAIRDMEAHGIDLKRAKGKIETDKTEIENPEVALKKPRTLRLNFKDGRLLNDAHIAIMRDISRALHNGDGHLVVLADLAYGNNVDFGDGNEPLRQSGQQFIDWFEEHHILDGRPVIIREITSPFTIRAERNEHSEERIGTDEFKLLFPDLADDYRGFFPADRLRLGSRLKHIHNAGITSELYKEIIQQDFEKNFLPFLNGEGREGKLPVQARR